MTTKRSIPKRTDVELVAFNQGPPDPDPSVELIAVNDRAWAQIPIDDSANEYFFHRWRAGVVIQLDAARRRGRG